MIDATHRHGPYGRGAERVPRTPRVWLAATPLEQAMAAETAPHSQAVHVVGNHGRWVVDCPDCNSAQLASPDDHRFMCNECANLVIGGLWRPVVWPKSHQKIADLLDARKDRHLRNYDAGQTLGEIAVENDYLAAVAAGEDHPGGPGLHPHHPGKASFWEGHTHRWPKKVDPGGEYVCPECEMSAPGLAIIAGRAKSGAGS